ncbi:hypothetical protein TI04_06865 [Achromatium sp. WMS2]|nr:hypothetical protein TI04_06865 [Achromatium sp. WMS2]
MEVCLNFANLRLEQGLFDLRYKYVRSYLVTMILLLAAANSTLAEGTGDIPAWKVGTKYTAILNTALAQKASSEVDIQTLNLPNYPGLVFDIIDSSWAFVYAGKNYIISESNMFLLARTADSNLRQILTMHTITDGHGNLIYVFFNRVTNSVNVQYFLQVDNNHVNIDVVNAEGKLITKDFTNVPFPLLADPVLSKKLLTMQAGQSIETYDFDVDSMLMQRQVHRLVVKNTPTVDRDGNWTDLIESTTGNAVIKIYYDSAKNIIRKAIYGDMQLVHCDLATIIKERGAPLTTRLNRTITIDTWLLNRSHLQKLVLEAGFSIPVETKYLFTNGRQHITRASGNKVTLELFPQVYPPAQCVPDATHNCDNRVEAADLAATSHIQSDAPEIIAMAKQIIGDKKDKFSQVLALANWVKSNINPTYDVAVGSALETLRSRRGDCSEDANLFVAMVRAIGIPARVATGWKGIGRTFTAHAWAEVFIDSWIEVDPTIGNLVGAAYIRDPIIPVKTESVKIISLAYDDQAQIIIGNKPYSSLAFYYSDQCLGLSIQFPMDSPLTSPTSMYMFDRASNIDPGVVLILAEDILFSPVAAILVAIADNSDTISGDLETDIKAGISVLGAQLKATTSFDYENHRIVSNLMESEGQLLLSYSIRLPKFDIVFMVIGKNNQTLFAKQVDSMLPEIKYMIGSMLVTPSRLPNTGNSVL